MTNKDFYAFCREKRKTETDQQKKTALTDLYHFMRECGVSKAGVHMIVDRRIFQASQSEQAEAYRWLLNVFQGTVQV